MGFNAELPFVSLKFQTVLNYFPVYFFFNRGNSLGKKKRQKKVQICKENSKCQEKFSLWYATKQGFQKGLDTDMLWHDNRNSR